MRKLTRSPKQFNLTSEKKAFSKDSFGGVQNKITFRCDVFLLEKIKNSLASQHLTGNYQYPNLSYFFHSTLHAYQYKMPFKLSKES